MLVVLDESLSKIKATDQAEISGLESILTASHNGEHFLTSSFLTIRALLKLPLSLKGAAVLQRLRSEVSGHGHLPYPESFVININLDGPLGRTSDRTWSAPIVMFKNKAFPCSVVLGENMLDAEAFIHGAKQARSKHRHREQCDAIPDAGGGSQTAVKLSGHATKLTGFCFCVTDGDYLDPSSSKSSVTSLCESIAKSAAFPMYATDFKARSIENIIPTSIIQDSFEGSYIPDNVRLYCEIEADDKEIANFIDAKVGLKYCHIKKISPLSPKFQFWINKIKSRNLIEKFDFLDANPPKCQEGGCKNCVLIEGLGATTLKRTVEYFEKNTPQRLAQRVSAESTWCILGLSIYHWIMADKPALI